jgi:hypothetical protein
MPSKVGTVTALFEDGSCDVHNELTGEEWHGQLAIGSGGMLMFTIVDERLSPIGGSPVHPEMGEAPTSARVDAEPRGQRARVGRARAAAVEVPTAE